jgi:hypothetical protein
MAGEDLEHLRRLRAMSCAKCGAPPPVEAHHSTHGRGMSQKTHDHLAIPLCRDCHWDFHHAVRQFGKMKKAERNAWQATMSERYMPKVPSDDVF